jgi:hypothetical protein
MIGQQLSLGVFTALTHSDRNSRFVCCSLLPFDFQDEHLARGTAHEVIRPKLSDINCAKRYFDRSIGRFFVTFADVVFAARHVCFTPALLQGLKVRDSIIRAKLTPGEEW